MTILAPASTGNSSRDYTWLKAKVAGWLHRSDLDADIPDFVMLAEKRINRDLEARLQNSTTMLETVAQDPLVALPDDFAEVRSLVIPGYDQLDYLPPNDFNERYAGGTPGKPRHYTVIGQSLYVGPTPDSAYTMQMAYRGNVPALADTDGTNWLIEQHADLYLAATMCEATLYTKDEPARATWQEKYAIAMSGLNASDWSSAGTLVVRADTKTP